jgi:PAS domain S-box-containing protein
MTFVVQVEKAEWIAEQDRDLLRAARTIPILLEPGFVERAIRPGSISHEEDQNNIERLSRMADALDLAYLYTLIDLDGTIYITSSSASEEERQSATEVRAFTLYSEMEEEVRATLASGTPHFRTYTDRWGTFRHVYIPLKNSRGIPYVLAADQGEGMLTAQLVPLLIKNALLPLFFVLIAIPFFIIYRKQLDKHAQHLQRLNRKVSATKERLEMATEASGIGVWEWNVQTGETIFNERWAEIIGYTLEELAPVSIETWTQFCHPDDQEESTRLLQECFTGERTYYNYETRMRHKNGDWIWVLDRGQVGSWTDDGQPRWMYGTHQDITERKRTEQAVVAERDLSRQYLDVAGVLMVALDNTQTVTMINPRGCDVLGAPREEILGKNWIDTFLPPEQIEEVKAVFNQLMTGELAPVEYHDNCIVRADGQQRTIAWHNAILKDAIGNITGLLSSGDDITERMEALQALRESEERARLMADLITNSNQPIAVGFADGRLGRLNPAFCELVGYTEEEMKAIDWAVDLTPPEWLSAEREVLAELERSGEPVRYEKEYVRKDGSRVPIELFVHLNRDQDGEPEYYFAFITDITERKRVAEAALMRERQYRNVIQTTSDGFWRIDRTLRLLEVNAAYCDMSGYSEQELLCMSISDLDTTEDPEDSRAHAAAIFEAGTGRFETRHRRKDGSEFDVEIITESDPEHEQFFVFIRDITERKKAREALQRSEATLRKAQEIAHIGSWELDLATERFTLSDEAYHMYGQEPREEGLSRADFMEWVHPDDRAYGKKLFEALLAEGEATFEYRVIRPGGEVRWITGRGITSFDQAGNPLKMFGIQQDITERKRIENRLRENEEQLQLMFKQAPLPLCMNAFDGTYLSANAAYEKLIGYTADELLGMTFFDITHPDDRPKNNDHLKDMSTDQAAGFEMEKRYLCKDGSQIIVMVHATTIHDAEGEPLFGLAVVEDITELKRAKQALLESHEQLETRVQARTTELQTRKEEAETLNRAMINLLQDLKETNLGLETTREALHATNNELEAFSYSVSHDLRAPLRHIDGFIKLLLKREKENLDETSARYLETIAQSSGRMGQLIDDLLAFARTGRAELHPKPVAPNELIQEITEELSSLSEERHLTWVIDDLPAVQADRNLLRQVWQNLIGNAIKYTEPCANARIEIGTTHSPNKEESDEIIFFIRDNGVGFDPQYKHKLFGVFQRLHRNDEFEGTGIGLATVRRIVHRHGGRVWAEGKIDGGATFFFTLKQAKGTK